MTPANRPTRPVRRRPGGATAKLFTPQVRAMAFVGAAAVVLWMKPMGLLLWARLRILANIPRTAVAEDEQVLADRFEPREWPAAPEAEVVVLPRAASRNPFAVSTPADGAGRHGPDSPRRPTSPRTSDPSDGAGGAKSSANPTEENSSAKSDGAMSPGAS